jgi:REP element-mobilizing transposase RayT
VDEWTKGANVHISTQITIINQSVGSIIWQWKSAVSKRCHELWYRFARQTRYYDHIVRDEREYNNIKQYIQNNPKKWKEDKFFIL